MLKAHSEVNMMLGCRSLFRSDRFPFLGSGSRNLGVGSHSTVAGGSQISWNRLNVTTAGI